MEREPKVPIRNGRGLAQGGLVTGTGPSPLVGGCDYLIPNDVAARVGLQEAKQDDSMDEFTQQLLNKATVHHLQPDDVIVFSNVGDTDPERFHSAIERLKEALGGRTLVFFHEDVDLDLLRDLEPEQ
jgi:hypothetical protein